MTHRERKQVYRDPVCRMRVSPDTAAEVVEYGGKAYYFCAPLLCRGVCSGAPRVCRPMASKAIQARVIQIDDIDSEARTMNKNPLRGKSVEVQDRGVGRPQWIPRLRRYGVWRISVGMGLFLTTFAVLLSFFNRSLPSMGGGASHVCQVLLALATTWLFMVTTKRLSVILH